MFLIFLTISSQINENQQLNLNGGGGECRSAKTSSIAALTIGAGLALSCIAVSGCDQTNPDDKIAVQDVSISPTSLTINAGDTITLQAQVLPDDAADKSVRWESDNDGIAVITQAGFLRAIAAGNARITATAGGISASCMVTVNPAGTPYPPDESAAKYMVITITPDVETRTFLLALGGSGAATIKWGDGDSANITLGNKQIYAHTYSSNAPRDVIIRGDRVDTLSRAYHLNGNYDITQAVWTALNASNNPSLKYQYSAKCYQTKNKMKPDISFA